MTTPHPQDDEITVTDIHCTCGVVHSFAGEKHLYLGSNKRALTDQLSAGPEREIDLNKCPKCGGPLQTTITVDTDDVPTSESVKCRVKIAGKMKKGCGYHKTLSKKEWKK